MGSIAWVWCSRACAGGGAWAFELAVFTGSLYGTMLCGLHAVSPLNSLLNSD
jgi:hypothetical protein